jgi:toxin ParE1/3/4
MPLHRVIYAAGARADLEAIAAYVAERTEDGAERAVALILERVDLLRRLPNAGRARPDIGDGLRAISVRSFVIVYRVEAGTVHILHVAHGARDLDRLAREWDR